MLRLGWLRRFGDLSTSSNAHSWKLLCMTRVPKLCGPAQAVDAARPWISAVSYNLQQLQAHETSNALIHTYAKTPSCWCSNCPLNRRVNVTIRTFSTPSNCCNVFKDAPKLMGDSRQVRCHGPAPHVRHVPAPEVCCCCCCLLGHATAPAGPMRSTSPPLAAVAAAALGNEAPPNVVQCCWQHCSVSSCSCHAFVCLPHPVCLDCAPALLVLRPGGAGASCWLSYTTSLHCGCLHHHNNNLRPSPQKGLICSPR